MKLDSSLFASVALVTSLGACTPPPAADLGPDVLSQEEATAIFDRTDEQWFAGVAEGGLTAAVELYTDDAVRMEPGRPTLVGKEAILAWLQSQFDRYDFAGSAVTDEVLVLGPDWILRCNHGEFTATPKAGGEVILFKESWITLLQQQPDGTWKVPLDIGKSDIQEPWK